MRRILSAGPPPRALFIASDLMAQGAIAVLAGAGLKVPTDVAIIGFDDSPVAETVDPPLTTIRQPSFEQGEHMVSVLLDLLAGGTPAHATILDTELIVRQSS